MAASCKAAFRWASSDGQAPFTTLTLSGALLRMRSTVWAALKNPAGRAVPNHGAVACEMMR